MQRPASKPPLIIKDSDKLQTSKYNNGYSLLNYSNFPLGPTLTTSKHIYYQIKQIINSSGIWTKVEKPDPCQL